jgi:predicted ester cyclase
MSTKENKVLLRRWYGAMSKGDINAWDNAWNRFVAPEYILHGAMSDLTLAQAKQNSASLWAAFSDISFSIDDIIAEGDKVAARCTLRGTHKGQWFGVAPTGKRFTVTGLEINRIAGGKFVETWARYDFSGIMAQLGVIPGATPKT